MAVSSTDYLHNASRQSLTCCDWVIESLVLSSCPEASANSSGLPGLGVSRQGWQQEAGGTSDGLRSSCLCEQSLYPYWNEDNPSQVWVTCASAVCFLTHLVALYFYRLSFENMSHRCLHFLSSRGRCLKGATGRMIQGWYRCPSPASPWPWSCSGGIVAISVPPKQAVSLRPWVETFV